MTQQTIRRFAHPALLLAGLAVACSFGTEVQVLDANDLEVSLGHAVTGDRSTLFTIEDSGILSAFHLDGTARDWDVLSNARPQAIANDPSNPGAARYLADDGITTVTVSGDDIIYSDTIPLPGTFATLCDLSVDLDGDVYITAVQTFSWYVWSELRRYDAQSSTWSAAFVDYGGSCPRVSADPAFDGVAVLSPDAPRDNVRMFDQDLYPTGVGFIDDSAYDLDLLGGTLLLGRIGTGTVNIAWHNHLELTDSTGAHLAESPVLPTPFFVQFDTDEDVYGWVGGEDRVSTLPIF